LGRPALLGGGKVDPLPVGVPHDVVDVLGRPFRDVAVEEVLFDGGRVPLQRIAIAGATGGEADGDDVVLVVRPDGATLELVVPLAVDGVLGQHGRDVHVHGVAGGEALHEVGAADADPRNGAGGVPAEERLRRLDLGVVSDGHHVHRRHMVGYPHLGGTHPAPVLPVPAGVLPVL